jgi:hypothetical protein
MTIRRWMITAAVVALVSAGLFTGSPCLITASLIFLLLAPLVLTLYTLARRLGWNTLFR